MSFIEVYVVTVTHLLAIPSIAYWLVYRRVQWKQGATGRALFNKARSLAFLIAVSLVGYWWPFPGYMYIYAAGLTYLTGAVTYQFFVMRKLIEHRQRRERALEIHTIQRERTKS